MILCDLLAFALDNPAPAVVMLISGDRDFNYAVSILRHRRYTVILVIPPVGAHITLRSQANVVLDWKYDIFAIEAREDKENYANASTAVGHPLGANGTGVLTGSLSLGSGSGLNGLSTQNTQSVYTSTYQSLAATPPTMHANIPVQSSGGLSIPSPSTETPLPIIPLNETPPQQTGSLPIFGSDVFLDQSPASTAFQGSPTKSQAGGASSWRRGSLVNSRVESPTVWVPISPPAGATNEEVFSTMIEILEHWRLLGNVRPLRSQLGSELKKKNPWVYNGAKANNFGEYTTLAEKAGVVVLGSTGVAGQEWIQLHERYQGKVFPLYI